MALSFSNRYFDEWADLDAVSTSGGIRVGWNSGKFIKIHEIKGILFLTVNLRCIEDNLTFISSAYGSPYQYGKPQYWAEFRNLSDLIDRACY